jgi:hypothetical protein
VQEVLALPIFTAGGVGFVGMAGCHGCSKSVTNEALSQAMDLHTLRCADSIRTSPARWVAPKDAATACTRTTATLRPIGPRGGRLE